MEIKFRKGTYIVLGVVAVVVVVALMTGNVEFAQHAWDTVLGGP